MSLSLLRRGRRRTRRPLLSFRGLVTLAGLALCIAAYAALFVSLSHGAHGR